MATVWAYRAGVFSEKPETGWSHSIPFSALRSARDMELRNLGVRDPGTSDLVERLEARSLAGLVDRLAIVAHGEPGAVFMSGKYFPEATAGSLRRLSKYLRRGGMLFFASCDAGAGPQGSEFLIRLSRELPGRVIVAPSIKGFFEQFANEPGNVQEAGSGNRPSPGTPRLTEWSNDTKWAFEGRIVRWPSNERKHLKLMRCANPGCPGHANTTDRCPYERWGSDPVLLRYNP